MIVRELESRIVPSVMVLVLGSETSLATIADAAAVGAKRVRFTEVTVRAMEPDVFRFRPLDDSEVSSQDGVIFVAANGAPAVEAIRRAIGARSLENTVMGRLGGDAGSSVALLESGGIVVSVAGDAFDEAYAQALGERVAKVAGWVHHALGHEAEHDHSHSHHHH